METGGMHGPMQQRTEAHGTGYRCLLLKLTGVRSVNIDARRGGRMYRSGPRSTFCFQYTGRIPASRIRSDSRTVHSDLPRQQAGQLTTGMTSGHISYNEYVTENSEMPGIKTPFPSIDQGKRIKGCNDIDVSRQNIIEDQFFL